LPNLELVVEKHLPFLSLLWKWWCKHYKIRMPRRRKVFLLSRFLTLSHPFSPFLALSRPFSPFLTLSHPFSPFLALSHPFSPFLALSHPFSSLSRPYCTVSLLSYIILIFIILGVYVLVIVPTHELAVQTFTQARRLLRDHEYITVGVSMGGAELSNEIELFSRHPRISNNN
jgi:hypothetical protein